MTDAQDPGMAEAVREIDRVIRLRKGDLETAEREMAGTQDHLTSLVDQAARLRLVIDALVVVREALAPMPTPEADALKAPTPPPSPFDVTCPTCGEGYGQRCRFLNVPRDTPHVARRKASARAAGEKIAADVAWLGLNDA